MAANTGKLVPPNRLNEDGGFKGKTILMTGATGFVGKVLIEKLLRTCPLLTKIFVIVRSKNGKNPQQRMKEIFANPLYDLLKKTRGADILEKVVAINGEVSELDLGLTKEDRKTLTDEVQIIYHVAATTRFDDPIKYSVLLNTRGTQVMINLGKECKKLLVFVHVSTAYCHPHEKVLYEKMYEPPADPEKIIKLMELLDDESATLLAKRLKGNSPNTYTYTKALAEGVVNKEMDNLPIIIVRPSLVIPIWKDPLPGWIDKLHGPAGLFVGAGKGIIRTMYCNSNGYIDLLPADIAANAIMGSTYDFMAFNTRRIYNLTTSAKVKVTWGEAIELGRYIVGNKMPLNWVAWYPGGSLKTSRLHHNICVVLFHYIPAIIVDSLLVLTGNKPVLWRIQSKVSKGFELFEYYANNIWEFNIDLSIEGLKVMNETEKEIYKLDEEGLDYEEYFTDMIHAARLYLLHESDESLPTARRHMKIMWVVDRLCKLLFLIGIGYLLFKHIVGPVFGISF